MTGFAATVLVPALWAGIISLAVAGARALAKALEKGCHDDND